MDQAEFNRRMDLGRKFWKRELLPHPLASFHVSDYLISTKFTAVKDLLVLGKTVAPDMLDVHAFISDFDRILAMDERVPSDIFPCVGVFSGIPWMEAICGCGVMAMAECFISIPCGEGPVRFSGANPWLRKYLEFLNVFSAEYRGRYPIVQTLLRGCLDVCGAMLGQEEMVFSMVDRPDETKKLLKEINRVYMQLVDVILSYSDEVGEGHVGPYGLWYPGRPLYFQEDLSSIVTPVQYREAVRPIHEQMCGRYGASVIHLHPTSFHCLDDILSIDALGIVQINKDDGGPSIARMMPAMRKVQQAGKGLVISASLTMDEIDLILRQLERKALMLDMFVGSVDEAVRIKRYLCRP
jgi:hypothetical protein